MRRDAHDQQLGLTDRLRQIVGGVEPGRERELGQVTGLRPLVRIPSATSESRAQTIVGWRLATSDPGP